MITFFERVRRAANQFHAVDYAFFKIYLISVGILLGTYLVSFFMEYITIVWIVAVASSIFTIAKLTFYYLKN